MVIDAHTHVGSLGVAGGGRVDPKNLDVEYDLRTKIMDQNDIDQAVVLPPSSYDKSNGIEAVRTLNESMSKIVKDHDRLVGGIATVEPTHGEAAVEELEHIADMGFNAVTWHHRFQGGAIDEPVTKSCLQRADDLNLVTFIHCFPTSNLEALRRIKNIAEYTTQPIVILDAFADYDNVELAIELGKEYDHLYFDTALMFSIGQVVESIVEELGSERLIFGSDLYTQPLMYQYSADLFQVRKAQISEDERQDILENNIRRILDL
jgi:predicted TIM-barrel fold metal-dependent hydrolase